MAGISDKALNKTSSQNKFNGGVELEEEFGVNLYSTFFRQYDPQLGRFSGVDIKSEENSNISNYQFALNNPITLNDPFGDKQESQNYASQWNSILAPLFNNSDIGGSWNPNEGFSYFTDELFAFAYVFGNHILGGGGGNVDEIYDKALAIYKGDRNFNRIKVFGKEAFKQQAISDLNVIASSKFGAIMLAYIELFSDKNVNISRARSVWNELFGCKSCEIKETITTDKPTSYSIAYSQYNGVEQDGVKTVSYLILGHELWHVIDINFQKSGKVFPHNEPNYDDGWYDRKDLGDDHRAFWERRAMVAENILAISLGVDYFRTVYSGVKIL